MYSEAHDFDLDWARPNVVEKYFAQVADPEKWRLHGSAADVIDKILEGLKPVSVARFLNHRGTVRFRLKEIDIAPCFVDFVLDIAGYVDLIFAARTVTAQEKQSLKDQIVRASTQRYDLRQLTNGHDFHCAVGACLRAELGSRMRPHTWGNEVEMHLRLTFSDDDFKTTQVYNQIIMWARDNKPYRILHLRFF